MTDRKIKKLIRNELAEKYSLEPSFTEFCAQAGIQVPERAPERKTPRFKPQPVAACVAAGCVAVAVAIVVPISLSFDPSGGVRCAVVAPDEVKRSGVLLFNERYVDDCPDFYRYYAEGDEADALAYRVNGVTYGDSQNAYTFDYLVRLSDEFEFEEQDIEVQFAFTKDGVRYEYALNWKVGGKAVTQVKFTRGDADYFVFLREYNGSDGFDVFGVQNFIEMAFAPVTDKSPWDDFFGD